MKKILDDCIDFFQQIEVEKSLPQILLFTSQDHYEFELIIEKYKKLIKENTENLETFIISSEAGDVESFYTEISSFDMFSSSKLYIIKKATNFFKGLNVKSKQKLASLLKESILSLNDKFNLLIHYDHWDTPKSVLNFLQPSTCHIKSKQFFPSEYRKKLQKALKFKKSKIEEEGIDTFIDKTPPTIGYYIKNIDKLYSHLNKKVFNLEDIKLVLYNSNEINFNVLVDFFFNNQKNSFHKEFSKFIEKKDSWLYFLNIFLKKLNQIRKFKNLTQLKYKQQVSEQEIYEILGFSSHFSPQRKSFLMNTLKKQAEFFNDHLITKLYEFCIDTNIKMKTSLKPEEVTLYLKNQINTFFLDINS